MKKIYTFLGVLFCFSQAIFAQTTAQIGTGTSSGVLYSPLYRFSASSTNDNSRSNILFTAAELTAQGITPGATISKLAFNKTNAGATVGSAIFKILMANSTKTAPLSTTTTWTDIQSTHTLVYDNSAQDIPAATGWVEFTLSTPFAYTGGNLEIATEFNISGVSGSPTTDAIHWEYTAGFADYIIGNVGTSSPPTTLSGTNSGYKNRPNIQIIFTAGSACSGQPNPGTASATPSGIVCPGTSDTLTLTGYSTGTGITFDWQQSSSATGPFTTIAGPSSSPTTIVNPTTTTYYRSAVTCNSSTSFSDTIAVTVSALFPAGTYSIDSAVATGGTNFQSFVDAVNAIKCGITGQVIFNVVPGSGPYTEQVMIDSIAGTSATSRVIFNGNGETISFLSTNTNERAGIKLNGADFITIKNLNITSTSTTTGTSTTEYGFGIHLLNNADNNIIDSCSIRMNVGNSGTGFSGIAISGSNTSATSTGSNSDSNMISNNLVIGGNAGITLLGSSTMPVYNNTIINNIIQDFDEDGIYLSNANSTRIEKNDISKPTRSNASIFSGIYLTSLSGNNLITKNRIHDPFMNAPTSTSTTYGIYITASDVTAGEENIIANNLVYNFNAGGTQYGLYNSSSNGVRYYHNTIDLSDVGYTGTSVTRGFGQFTTAENIELINNIFTISRGGNGEKHVLYFGATTTASTITSNYNDLFISSTGGTVNAIGYTALPTAATYTTLGDWQAATGQDANSLSLNPVYASSATGDLTPTSAAIDNKGIFVGITTDIVDTVRSATTPDMGAYEFAISGCSAPPTPGTIVASNNNICPGEPITLGLAGNSVGIGQTYRWQTSSSLAGPFTSVGNDMSFADTVINPTMSVYYRAAVTCSNSTVFSDTLLITVNQPIGDTLFTINSTQPSGNGNFQSFGEAVDALKCGVNGPVQFNVVAGSGPYNEQVLIKSITGASAINRITFNGNGDSIRFVSTTSADRAGIKLDGADYITIKNLVISSTSTTTGTTTSEYGFGIQLINGADHNIIDSCTINMNLNNTSTNFAGIVISASNTSATTAGTASASDSNLISNNVINGGNYGITVVGSTSALINGNQVINNTINDFDEDGIYVSGTNFTRIEGNNISRPTRTAFTTFTGIYFTGLSENAFVSKNRIHDPFGGLTTSTSTAYGIYFTAADATAGNENIVSNNAVYNFIGGTSQYGLYNSSSNGVFYYHNTVTLDDVGYTGTAITRGFYQTTLASGIELKNNNFSISRTSTGSNHVLYFNTSTSTITSDYNNLFISSTTGSANAVGYNGTTQTTLSDWQAATTQDANSVSVDPMFINASSGNLTPTNSALDNKGTPVGILTDIYNMPRSASLPDIGAVEFTTTLPVTILQFSGVRNLAINTLSWTTVTEHNNAGFELQRSADGNGFSRLAYAASKAINGNSTGSISYSFDDVKPFTGNSYYRLKQIDKDGKFSYSPIVLIKGGRIFDVTISSIYPNPAKSDLNMIITSPTAETIRLVVTDMSGKVVMQQAAQLVNGDNQLRLQIGSLLSGTYMIKTVCANGCESAVNKFVKE